jgi:PHD/YefM family antitoxin component YafN of YafNO toxin-antitoxin module
MFLATGELVMRAFTEKEAKQQLSKLLDLAQSGPIAIRRGNEDVAIVVAASEYERLRQLSVEEFQRLCDRIGRRAKRRGLTEEKLNAMLSEGD